MSVKRPPLLDLAIAAAVAAALLIERFTAVFASPAQLGVSVGFALIISASLIFRRRWPLLSYVVGSIAMILDVVLGAPAACSPYANLIGLFSLGAYGSKRHALIGPVILVPGVLAYFAATDVSLIIPALSVVFVWLAAWALGYQTARGREQQEAARAAHRREVVADERLRIARDLHDVVGHTVNLMLVQTGATRLVLDSDPAKAKQLLSGVESAGREALDELDELLGLLRDDSTQPGLAQLPALAARLGDAGLQVTLDVHPAPPEADAVAYRIVQEALTNAIRHGGATAATVRVHGADPLVIEVDDNGRGAGDYTPGRGLRGMAERAAALGGQVEHHSDASGFHVRARL